MRFLVWPRDTIARRFAETIVLAAVATLGFIGLFFAFGGVWAQPSIVDLGLPGVVAGITRVIDAAPPPMRQALAASVATEIFRVDWYDRGSALSEALDRDHDVADAHRFVGELLGDAFGTIIVVKTSDPLLKSALFADARVGPPFPYLLAIKCRDHSWLVFTALQRIWGLPPSARRVVWLGFFTVSIVIVSAIASRRLSRPVAQLADAVRRFGINPQAPPLAETGPEELRQVARTFNAMQAQIQKFVAYRTMMLAAISHDLRTPLTRMRLRGEFIDDPEQQARLFRDVDEMQTMVDGALVFFRDDVAEEATTAFDLPGVLRTIVNDYADQGIDIGYTGPAHAVYRGRPFALKRAFTNVVENAIKYATPPAIELCSRDDLLVVTIRDHGPGIPSDALGNVFNPFYRLDKSRNRATGGVGLGLTAAQAIVRSHGGEITLANRADGGLSASIALPVTVSSV
ncbi:MAG: ATP-binding protein [Azospirillaceae bacterium]|nr:ATP-binding protein [Azospirillaceae bacterium]